MNTYDKQVIIVKPDFFNEKGLEIIKFYLNKYKVCVDSFYLIDNYKEYNKKFRELEVLSELDNSVDQVSKLESMKITNKAYELMYKNKALLIVINNNNLAPDEFFLRLRLIKVEIREKYVKQRPFKIYLKIENGKESIDLRGKEEILDKNLFYETHLNGIHFAHYNNFYSGFDYQFAKKIGVIEEKYRLSNYFYDRINNDLVEPEIDFSYFLCDHDYFQFTLKDCEDERNC